MNKLFRTVAAGLLSSAMILGMVGCSSSNAPAESEALGQEESNQKGDAPASTEVSEVPGGSEAPGDNTAQALVEPDVPVKEIELSETDKDYYSQLFEAEVYNYKLIRNIPTAYEETSWDNYCSNANILLTLDPKEIGEVQQGLITKALEARKGLVQVQSLTDSIWYIWGDTVPVKEKPESLKFKLESYDNSDFKPFLVPYLLEDQSTVKGNMIVIAGGGYSSRGNSGEGWPIAKGFNELGYNCYVLQRRVEPYCMEDIWMDMQRSIRYIRHNADAFGIGGTDCMIATGFSGGGMTILGCVQFLYGDLQPTIYAESYVPDEVDAESADLDIACIMYGPHALMGNFGEQKTPTLETDFQTDNPNLPAFFITAGADDALGTSLDGFALEEALKDKTLVEYHNFEKVGHGFGVGIAGTNSMKWMDLADGFIDLVKADKAPADNGPASADIPDEYTKVQVIFYPFSFGETAVVLAINEDNTKFYASFVAFEEQQILEGIVSDGTVTVTFDKSGFMSGDAQAIYDAADPNAWGDPSSVGAAAGGNVAEIPADYTQMQTITYPFGFGDTEVTVAINEDGSGFYAVFTAFEEQQILEGIVSDGTVTVTFDKSGFMSGDAQAIYDSVDPNGWKPIS